jgi:hypothetical protein
MSNRRIITEFILLIADDWIGRASDVLNEVESVGGEVMSVDEENGILDGRIQTMDLPRLERLACVHQLAEGASYVTYGIPGAPDRAFGYGHHGGVRQGTSAHAPKPHHSADIHPRPCRPFAGRAKSGTPVSPPARPGAPPEFNRPALGPPYRDLSQRLLWKAEDRLPCDRSRHRPAIPMGVRLAYGMVLAMGVAIAIRSVMDQENVNWLSTVRLLSGSLLAALATLAACGLCRFPLIRNACTGVGLWLALSACLLQRTFPEIDMALSLAAFLIAGCAVDALGDA